MAEQSWLLCIFFFFATCVEQVDELRASPSCRDCGDCRDCCCHDENSNSQLHNPVSKQLHKPNQDLLLRTFFSARQPFKPSQALDQITRRAYPPNPLSIVRLVEGQCPGRILLAASSAENTVTLRIRGLRYWSSGRTGSNRTWARSDMIHGKCIMTTHIPTVYQITSTPSLPYLHTLPGVTLPRIESSTNTDSCKIHRSHNIEICPLLEHQLVSFNQKHSMLHMDVVLINYPPAPAIALSNFQTGLDAAVN